jgi:hypothetical protein
LGHNPVFAGNDWQLSFISQIFPSIETQTLEGYNVRYSTSSSAFMFTILRQLPGLLKKIKEENQWLRAIIESERIDAVISDNRYGLFHSAVPCAILTHQLLVRTGLGPVFDSLLRPFHYRYLEKFNQCWIVDTSGEESLAGSLSHPGQKPKNAKYVGLLSQFQSRNTYLDPEKLLILLSGPEPQRSLLSDILWDQVKHYSGEVIFVEGRSDAPKRVAPSNIEYYGLVSNQDLQELIEKASMVICRSGYSSLMDLVELKKKAIIIPTPGQTEQEYLGKYLHQKGMFFRADQRGFNLEKTLEEAAGFPFNHSELQNCFHLFKPAIHSLINSNDSAL